VIFFEIILRRKKITGQNEREAEEEFGFHVSFLRG
jgi:hypothetical protein